MDIYRWTEIVSPQKKENAEAAFLRWKKDNAELADKLSPQDVRIDTIRSSEKKMLVRYMIRLRDSKNGL